MIVDYVRKCPNCPNIIKYANVYIFNRANEENKELKNVLEKEKTSLPKG